MFPEVLCKLAALYPNPIPTNSWVFSTPCYTPFHPHSTIFSGQKLYLRRTSAQMFWDECDVWAEPSRKPKPTLLIPCCQVLLYWASLTCLDLEWQLVLVGSVTHLVLTNAFSWSPPNLSESWISLGLSLVPTHCLASCHTYQHCSFLLTLVKLL